MIRTEELEAVARALCLIDGVDPESIIDEPGRAPEMAWHSYREQARWELTKAGADAS